MKERFSVRASSSCQMTRRCAILIGSGGQSYRRTGFDKTKLWRIVTSRWSSPPRYEPEIIDLCCSKIFGEELGHEYGELSSRLDAEWGRRWVAIHRQRQQLDVLLKRPAEKRDEEAERRNLLEAEQLSLGAIQAGTKPSSLMQMVCQAAALTHLAGNPLVHLVERAEHRQKGSLLVHDLVDAIGCDYSGLDLRTFLSAEHAVSENPFADISGVLLSTALDYLNQMAAGQSGQRWLETLAWLDDLELLGQIAVRGVVLREPDAIVNAAEAFFCRRGRKILDDAETGLLLRFGQQLEPALGHYIGLQWRQHFDPDFVREALVFLGAPQFL